MNQRKDAPIGAFDSGVGGLTVAREIMRNLPHERIVYFGDSKQEYLMEVNQKKRLSAIPDRLSVFCKPKK